MSAFGRRPKWLQGKKHVSVSIGTIIKAWNWIWSKEKKK